MFKKLFNIVFKKTLTNPFIEEEISTGYLLGGDGSRLIGGDGSRLKGGDQ